MVKRIHLWKKYVTAEKYSKQSMELAVELKILQSQADSWSVLANLYEKQHKSDKALNAYKNFITFCDSDPNAKLKECNLPPAPTTLSFIYICQN